MPSGCYLIIMHPTIVKLKLVEAYKGSYSPFEELLKKVESVLIHQRNLELLAMEMFKTQRNFNPSFIE